MKPAFWIGLAIDGVGALALVAGIYLVFEPAGVPLILASVLLMTVGSFVAVGSSISSSLDGVGRTRRGPAPVTWVSGPQAGAGPATPPPTAGSPPTPPETPSPHGGDPPAGPIIS